MQFACIKCRGILSRNESGFICARCGAQWEARDGINRFTDQEYFWSVFGKDEIGQVLSDAREKGWRKSIQMHLGHRSDYINRYVLNYDRADFFVYLPLHPDAIVLDLGCGWGNVSIVMAKRCLEVVCCDVTVENLQLLQLRALEEKVANIHYVVIPPLDMATIPLPERSVDVAILNGVLEWVGNASTKGSPRKVQTRALGEILRVLKPGGVLYTGIENRFCSYALKGGRLHGELPFIGLLPRSPANLITKIATGKPHRTYVYSIRGYRKLFRAAGFADTELYWIRPHYHHPRIMIPLSDRTVLKYWARNTIDDDSLVKRLFKRYFPKCLPFEYLAGSYGIISKKASA